MGIISVSSSSYLTNMAVPEPIVNVYIGGQFRPDAVVREVRQTSGFAADEATIEFPLATFPSCIAPAGAQVTIFINRWIDNKPKFRGFVTTPINDQADDEDEDCFIVAKDERVRLNNKVCRFNFNEAVDVPRMGEEVFEEGFENLKSKAIANEMMNEYTAWQSTQGLPYLTLDYSRFPNVRMREFKVKGTPIGTALERLLRDSTDAASRLRMRLIYTGGSHDMLRPFEIGSSESNRNLSYNIIFPTHTHLLYSQQPFGFPMVEGVKRVVHYDKTVNSVTAQGGRHVVQDVLTLTESWDQSLEIDVLSNEYVKFTTKEIKGQTNPNYNPQAEWVGRRYLIPTITVKHPRTGKDIDVQPKLLERILDVDPEEPTAKAAPFCLLVYLGMEEDLNAQMRYNGFTIEDGRFILFDRPITNQVPGEGTPPTFPETLPETVKLVCTYELPERLEVTVEPTSSMTWKREELIEEETYRWETWLENSVRLTALGTVELVEVETDLIKEDDELDDMVDQLLEEVNRPDWEWEIVLPYCPTNFNVGGIVILNRTRLMDASIVGIVYNIEEAETRLLISGATERG